MINRLQKHVLRITPQVPANGSEMALNKCHTKTVPSAEINTDEKKSQEIKKKKKNVSRPKWALEGGCRNKVNNPANPAVSAGIYPRRKPLTGEQMHHV